MKISIKSEIYCNYDNLKRYLPARYIALVNNGYYGETVNLVCFPIDKLTITSSEVLKAQKKIVNTDIRTFYFARCFTIEATQFITESNGVPFYSQDYPWFDAGYNSLRGGKSE